MLVPVSEATGASRIPALCRRALVLILLASQTSPAARHALLVGVGTYPGFPTFHLDGPAEDVPAMRAALIRTWGFPQQNIRSLVDSQATKANIMAALDHLVKVVRTGDQVFIYFSGHGTSALDPRNQKLGLPLNSGALIPCDVTMSLPGAVIQQLIVGVTDLKPRLQLLDAKASVFVVFDSCYSGAAVKSVAGTVLASRSVSLSAMARAGDMGGDAYDAAYTTVKLPTVDPDSYPYQNLVFLSAAAQSEQAFDATAAALRTGALQTLDGKPHGLLTDSLLRAFRGEADEDHDGTITYEEVRRFALTRVMNHGQTPQLLPTNRPGVTARAIFGVTPAQLPPPPAAASERRGVSVSVSPGAQEIAGKLAELPNVRVVRGEAADLAVTKAGDLYELYVANGVRIQQYSPSDLPRLLARVQREPEIRRIREWSFPNQSFHARLDVVPSNRDAYSVNEAIEFSLSADRPSYLLLLNIDVSGDVTLVYKTDPAKPETAGLPIRIPTCVTPPVGTEYLKAFAFSTRPKGWESLTVTGGTALQAQFRSLLEVLQSAPPTSAQASWLTYSTDQRPPSGPLCSQ